MTKKEGLYTTGEFAKKAHVSLRTIRWYDSKNVLKPSGYTASGTRLYSDADFAKLQQILLFKYLGFSLDDIREMTMTAVDENYILGSLEIQKKLVQEKIQELQDVQQALEETYQAIENPEGNDWKALMNLIHITSTDQSLKTQYQNATNISARIRLHKEYSINPEGWFPWLMKQASIQENMDILEIGCGNGALWKENMDILPKNLHVTLSDISTGMIRDAYEVIAKDARFTYRCFDAQKIPFAHQTFDVVFANHMLFYCQDINQVLKECARVLRPDGYLICSTYSKKHMQEITSLVQEFDEDIVLSSDFLYERFGLENGKQILSQHFDQVEERSYPDEILIYDSEPLIDYIVSCHGNQNRILIDRYKEFRNFVKKKTAHGFHITKDAGIFLCRFEKKDSL